MIDSTKLLSYNSQHGNLTLKSFKSTDKETSNNNNADGHKTKLFTYPVARKNDSETDYFMMEIAEYQAPGLDLPAFTVDKNDAGEKTGISNLKPNEKTGTFSNGTETAGKIGFSLLPKWLRSKKLFGPRHRLGCALEKLLGETRGFLPGPF